jgi:hypothetical protein
VKEQVKSGFLIAGKLVAAFCLAAVFLSGCALVHEAASSSEIVIGWLLITLSIVVMAFTVSFWLQDSLDSSPMLHCGCSEELYSPVHCGCRRFTRLAWRRACLQ